jgi:phage terminase Nu1 subunit (DNA packaging protein)
VRELAKAGIAVRAERGLYRLEEGVRRYCEHIRRTASQRGGGHAGGAHQIAREQADALALKNAAARGQLLEVDAVEREWSDVHPERAAPQRQSGRFCAGRSIG